jgi:hypothetical protein
MPVHGIRFLGVLLGTVLASSSFANAQQSASSTADSSVSTPAPNPASVVAANGPLSDYVPCMFSEDEQGSMRAQGSFQHPLDERSARRLLDAINVALAKPLTGYSQAPVFLKEFQTYFQENLRPADLVGMTPEQANTHIQSILVSAVQKAASQQMIQAGTKSLISDSERQQKKIQAAEELSTIVANAVEALKRDRASSDKKKQSQAPTSEEFIRAGENAITNAAASNKNLSTTYLQEVAKLYREYTSQFLADSIARRPEDLARVARQAALDAQNYPYSESPDFSPSKAVADLTAAVGASADIAVKKTEAKKYQPPEDVSCSMAVMSWKETRDIFGRRVANTFVAFQVNLRNLNNKNEFLVHDIQVAVDTGIKQEDFGRFQAGRDKLLVRGVAERGRSDDRRNRVLNSLQAIGAIAGASSITAGTVEFKDAVAIFQGSFITGFGNIFPDHTVEQLNHINDLVFSASNTSKVVVPVQGSVPLVTFISEKPIEQLPFAWCGHPPKGQLNPGRWLGRVRYQNCDFNGQPHNPGYVDQYHYGRRGQVYDGSITGVSDRDEGPWSDLAYRDWRAAALRMLQEHTFVVVGGVHIQEVVNQPKITNLDCPTVASGQVDISKTQDGTVTCSVTGTGLGLVSAVTLQKGDSKISGKSKAAGDGNSATLSFKPEDLCGAEGPYSLFLTYKSDAQKDGTDLDSGDSALLAKQPTVTTISFANSTLTLNGVCLDQVKSVSLAPQVTTDNTVNGADPAPDGKNTTATIKFPTQTSKDSVGLKPAAVYYLTYSTKIQPNTQIKKESLTITVPNPTASNEGKPASNATGSPTKKHK